MKDCKHEKEHTQRRDILYSILDEDKEKDLRLWVWCADCGKKLRVVELEG